MAIINYFVFNGFIPKVNQITRTIKSNLNAVQPTVRKILRPQAFGANILKNGHLWLGALQKYMGKIRQAHCSYVKKSVDDTATHPCNCIAGVFDFNFLHDTVCLGEFTL